jgi:hypothetical protein
MPCISEEIDLYSNPKVIEVFSQSLTIGSYENMFNFDYSSTRTSLGFDLSPQYTTTYENTEWKIGFSDFLSFGYSYEKWDDYLKDEMSLYNRLDGNFIYYINNILPFPISIINDPTLEISWQDMARNTPGLGFWEHAGIGFGRIINIGPISKAAQLCRNLGEPIDADIVSRLSETIGKECYYKYKYWDAFEKEYFNLINGSLGNKYEGLDLKYAYDNIGFSYPKNAGFEFNI